MTVIQVALFVYGFLCFFIGTLMIPTMRPDDIKDITWNWLIACIMFFPGVLAFMLVALLVWGLVILWESLDIPVVRKGEKQDDKEA